MKLPAFDYASPSSLSEAIELLRTGAGEAKVIAGGQSLVPTMAFRLATPKLLVDLRNVPDLNQIKIDRDGVRLGATVRWRDIEDDTRLKVAHPLLLAAISHVAHYQIRNRGTVGGSIAHADPAAEMPGIAVVCDAEIAVVGPSGSRIIPAKEFFVGALSTSLKANEIAVEIRLPSWPRERRWGFEEFSQRRGDFALAGVAVFYDVDGHGRASNSHVGVIGVCDRPTRIAEAEAALNGSPLNENSIAAAVAALSMAVKPMHDFHASGEYRRAVAGTLLERALRHSLELK